MLVGIYLVRDAHTFLDNIVVHAQNGVFRLIGNYRNDDKRRVLVHRTSLESKEVQ